MSKIRGIGARDFDTKARTVPFRERRIAYQRGEVRSALSNLGHNDSPSLRLFRLLRLTGEIRTIAITGSAAAAIGPHYRDE